MKNKILKIEIEDYSVQPISAELRIHITLESADPATEVRGRLMGPTCPYSSTVEIAYGLQPLQSDSDNILSFRVVIPEPSFWDPLSPFLYSGPIELYENGSRIEKKVVTHGLRAVTLSRSGLLVNGRAFSLQIARQDELSEDVCPGLRNEGIDTILIPGEKVDGALPLADRYGFFLLCQVTSLDSKDHTDLEAFTQHPSFLGWVVESPTTISPSAPGIIGTWASRYESSGSDCHFLIASQDDLALCEQAQMPCVTIDSPGTENHKNSKVVSLGTLRP